MTLQPFTTWIQNRQFTISEPDRLLLLIKQAGSQGMTRDEIGGVIKMDWKFLDEFLNGLVQAGMLRLVDRGGMRVYWSV